MATELQRNTVLTLDQMLIRKNFWTLFGAKFRIFDMNGALVATSKQKAFKLKEDIRVYQDEAMTQELLTIHARGVIDFGSAYDVIDATTGEKVGALARKGWKSVFRDEWHILDMDDQVSGTIMEDSGAMALVRRFLINLIPQTFNITFEGNHVGSIKQHFNPFV
ncbi:MAG: hypothetical protein KC561_12090, partial [Myxococcales bacterium]|nr:hypothetical protein [Myxococcales bacterium]